MAEAPSHSEVSECGEVSELAAALMLETLEEQERRRQEWVAYYLGAGEVVEARALGWEGDGDSDGDTAAFLRSGDGPRPRGEHGGGGGSGPGEENAGGAGQSRRDFVGRHIWSARAQSSRRGSGSSPSWRPASGDHVHP